MWDKWIGSQFSLSLLLCREFNVLEESSLALCQTKLRLVNTDTHTEYESSIINHDDIHTDFILNITIESSLKVFCFQERLIEIRYIYIIIIL